MTSWTTVLVFCFVLPWLTVHSGLLTGCAGAGPQSRKANNFHKHNFLFFPHPVRRPVHLNCILQTARSQVTSMSSSTNSTLPLSFSRCQPCVTPFDYNHATHQSSCINLHSSCFSMRNCKAMAASTITGGSVSSVKQIRAEFTAVARFLSSLNVMSPKLCNTQHAYRTVEHKNIIRGSKPM